MSDENGAERYSHRPYVEKIKDPPKAKIEGKLTVTCDLVGKVSLLHNFPTDRNGGKTYSSDFSCPYAEKGGRAFCVYQGRIWEPCPPFEFLKEKAKTTKIYVDENRNGREITFEEVC